MILEKQRCCFISTQNQSKTVITLWPSVVLHELCWLWQCLQIGGCSNIPLQGTAQDLQSAYYMQL